MVVKIDLVKVIIRLVEEGKRLEKGIRGIKVITVVAIIRLVEVDSVKATRSILVVGFKVLALTL